MSCKTATFQGLSNCKKLLERVAGIALTKDGTTFTYSTFTTGSTWQTNIADDEPLQANINTLILPVLNYEKTTDEPEIQTSNLGIKTKTQDNAPSGRFHIDTSFCDYKTLHDLEGINFNVVLILNDGTLVGTNSAIDTIKGFKGTVYTKKDIPESDNAQMGYMVDIMFRNVGEFEDMVLGSPEFTLQDLLDYVPVGLGLRIKTTYTSGDTVFQVNTRCTTTGKTGIDQTTDWEILESDATPTVAVTAVVDDGLGQYTVTIQQDNDGTPANITSGKYYVIICHDDDGSNLTYLSNTAKETVS